MPIISRKDSLPWLIFDLPAGISAEGRIFQDYAQNEKFVNSCFCAGACRMCGEEIHAKEALQLQYTVFPPLRPE